MISFRKLQTVLDNSNRNKTWLRTNSGIGGATYNKIISAMETPISEGVSISAINRICAVLNCQPGDIMEWIPDDGPKV